MKNILITLSVSAMMLTQLSACAMRVGGTRIDKKNNLYGVITDSKTGKGIAGVPVTDGYKFTVTDKNGVYQMVADSLCRTVYYTIPAGYKVALAQDSKLPLFYSTASIDLNKKNRNDFTLEPLASEEKNFTFVAVGDPQCKTDHDVARFRDETVPDMKNFIAESQREGKYKDVYIMTMGDIVFNAIEQWDPMKDVLSGFTADGKEYIPVFNMVGNHDHDADMPDPYSSVSRYVERFGPTDYSFDRGDVHFVVMDNVMPIETNGKSWTYSGGITDTQLKWLKEDLNLVKDKQDKMVFFCTHIPFRGGVENGGASVNRNMNYSEVLQLLTDFHEAHIMVGHTHYPQNWIHENYVTKGGAPIYEHVHGAACGAWWCCNMNPGGAPNGYSLYEIEGNHIANWLAKGTGEPASFQMRVYDGNQIYGGEDGSPKGKYRFTWTEGGVGGKAKIKANGDPALKNCFVAAIWNDDDTNWKVELYIDGKKAGDFRRVSSSITDICVSSFFFNRLKKNTKTWVSTTANHYWYVPAPGGDPSKVRNWEVRATQTIPGSGQVNVYTCSSLHTDYAGFINED